MDREVLFALLVLLICGPALWISGAAPGRSRNEANGRHLERRAWISIWSRLLLPCAAFAALLGWAFKESEPADESLLPATFVIVIPVAVVWMRAAIRAALALMRPSASPLAATSGIFRPSIIASPEVIQTLDERASRALLLHEEAHLQHRDPLRIWLGQLATDLQFPWPPARERFRNWLHALELARDEEARLRGADGVDLAAAVLAVAKMKRAQDNVVEAPLTGNEVFQIRIARLLAPLSAVPGPTNESSWKAVVTTASFLVAAFLFGIYDGDTVIRALPGVVKCVATTARFVAAAIV